MTAVQR